MKKIAKAFSGLILIAALFVLGNSLVITYPDEYMIVRQFGEIVRVVETPGVSVKIPFIQTSAPIPKALQIYDIPKSDVITKDKKSMIADAFVLWKISDPVLFTRHLNGQVAQAQSRIAASVFSSMKSVISNMDQTEIIENRDGKLAEDIKDNIGGSLDGYGIAVLAVETKSLDMPDDNKQSVYDRMISERNNIAASYTAQGNSSAQKIKNDTTKEVSVMKSEANAEAENVRIITKADGIYEGTCQLVDASVHVNGSYEKTERTWDTVEVLVDEDVTCREDAVKLGIMPGDYVCFEPRTRITPSGYIKSRFLDDKLSAAILMGYAKYLKDESVTPERRVYAHFTIYEEVGHGGSASVPEGVTEAWSVDMGCVGEGLQCTEREVSICAKDSGGPYNYDILCRLVELAKEHGIGYAVDVYPHYGSDVETTLKAGHDVRHALIGPGVYASHGYERSHRDGAENTFRLIQAYIG